MNPEPKGYDVERWDWTSPIGVGEGNGGRWAGSSWLKLCYPISPATSNVLKFVESRAPELDSLHAAISARVNRDFRNFNIKGRRTTGHRASKGRRRKRQKEGDEPAKSDSAEKARKKDSLNGGLHPSDIRFLSICSKLQVALLMLAKPWLRCQIFQYHNCKVPLRHKFKQLAPS